MDIMPSVVQAVGILLLSVGAAMLSPAIGVMVGGAGLLAFGLAWERSR